MTRVVAAEGLPRALAAALAQVADALDHDALAAAGIGLLALGADDPLLPGPPPLPEGRVAVLAACGPSAPGPWAHALAARADAAAVLTRADAAVLGVDAPVVGLPRPEAAPPGRGLSADGAPPGALTALTEVHGPVAPDAPGVAWVWGAGSAAVAAAARAWAEGRAVVALPGTAADALLRAGGALRAHGLLEAAEATAMVLASAPLAHALAHRGAAALDALPPAAEVARRVTEALTRPATLAPS
ncbi:MAG: hypothetical protein AB7O78_07585 [Thermoleophilia bacterium]